MLELSHTKHPVCLGVYRRNRASTRRSGQAFKNETRCLRSYIPVSPQHKLSPHRFQIHKEPARCLLGAPRHQDHAVLQKAPRQEQQAELPAGLGAKNCFCHALLWVSQLSDEEGVGRPLIFKLDRFARSLNASLTRSLFLETN